MRLKKRHRIQGLLLAVFIGAQTSSAIAESLLVGVDAEPFQTANRSSYIRSLGLPTAESGQWFKSGRTRVSITSELTSQFFVDDTGQQQALLDGETTTVTVRYRQTVSDSVEWGFDIPYIWQDGGGMDSFVEGWHRTFGLPNAGRDDYPRNTIRYKVDAGINPNDNDELHAHAHGLADVAASIRWRLSSGVLKANSRQYKQASQNIAFFLKVEAPTGDAKRFTGSDSWDVALGITAFSADLFEAIGASFNGNMGVLLPGDNDMLTVAMKNQVFYGSMMLAWPFIWEGLTLKAQVEAHTPFYESDIKPLGDSSWQLSFGGSVALSSRWAFSVGMSEDVSPHTAPDFTLLATLSYR